MKPQEFCCFCGSRLNLKILRDGTKEKYCSRCSYVFFDSPCPAVIVLIVNANKVLLTRASEWKHPYWGLISGYVKAGETAEEAAIREVREEVGLKIRDLEFHKTFAYSTEHRNSLMIAFWAKTSNSKIKKSRELKNARWFDLEDPLPMRSASISSQIVHDFFLKATYANMNKRKRLSGDHYKKSNVSNQPIRPNSK